MSDILNQLQKTTSNVTHKRTFVGVDTKRGVDFVKNEEKKDIDAVDGVSKKSIISNDIESILDRIRNRMKKSSVTDGIDDETDVGGFDGVSFFAKKNNNVDNEVNNITDDKNIKVNIDGFIEEKNKRRVEQSELSGINGGGVPVIDENETIKIKKKKIKKKTIDDSTIENNSVENKEKINISGLSTGEIIKLVKEGKLKYNEVLNYIKNNKSKDIKPIGVEHKENISLNDNTDNTLGVNDKKVKIKKDKTNINNFLISKVLKLVKEGKLKYSDAIKYLKNNKLNIVDNSSKLIQQKKDINSDLNKGVVVSLDTINKEANGSNISVGDVIKPVEEIKMTHDETLNYIRNRKLNIIDNETIQNDEFISLKNAEKKIIKNDIIDEDIGEIINKTSVQKLVINNDEVVDDNLISKKYKTDNVDGLQEYSNIKKRIRKSIITDDDFLIKLRSKNTEEDVIKQQIDNSFVEDSNLFLVKQNDVKDAKIHILDIQNTNEVIKEEGVEKQNIIEENIAPINDELQVGTTKDILEPSKNDTSNESVQLINESQDDDLVISQNKESNDFLQNLMKVEENELPQNVDNVEKKEEKEEEIEYIYSSVIDFTSSIPIESFVGDDYEKIRADKCVFLDSHITEADLIELYKTNKDVESLDISNCDNLVDFSIISKFENLKELNVNNCDNFDNIECLQGCKNLRVLNIGNTKIRNIDNIGIFPELRIFNCSCNSITNVKNICKCEKLIELNLWGCVSVGDLNGLENLCNLRSLDVDSTSIIDLFPLVNCKNMEFLFMDNCTKLTDFYTLSSLSNLKCLLADGKNMMTDSQLEVFEDLVNLEYITLNSRRIHSLYNFRKLTKMKELNLQGCNVTDLSPIENLTELLKLDVTANSALRDLSPLYKMTKLKKLIVGGGGVAGGKVGNLKGAASSTMAIEDIGVVKNFTKLKEINLNSNIRLKDISAMSVCEKMEEINLSKCTQLEDVSVLGKLKNIQKLDISSCPRIKELYFLRNLPELSELLYNGTIVSTPGLTTILKKANGIYLLKGNDADILSQAMLSSGKKKAKLMKVFKSYFPSKETEDKK